MLLYEEILPSLNPGCLFPSSYCSLCYNIKVHAGRQDNLIVPRAVTLVLCFFFFSWLILNWFGSLKLHSLTSWIQSSYSFWPVFILMPLKFASIFSLCFLPALLCPFIHDERVVTDGALWSFPADNISSISWALSQEKMTVPKNFESMHFSLALCLPLSSLLLLLSAPSPVKNTYGLRFPQLLSC